MIRLGIHLLSDGGTVERFYSDTGETYCPYCNKEEPTELSDVTTNGRKPFKHFCDDCEVHHYECLGCKKTFALVISASQRVRRVGSGKRTQRP